MRRYAERFSGGSSGVKQDEADDRAPAALLFAEGSAILKHLDAGGCLIRRVRVGGRTFDIPKHILGFRRIFCATTEEGQGPLCDAERGRIHALWTIARSGLLQTL